MSTKKTILIFILIFSIGLGIFVYPFVKTWINDKDQKSVVYDVQAAIQDKYTAEIEALWAEAYQYNASLTGLAEVVSSDGEVLAPTEDNYNNILAFANGTMGYLEIPKIDVALPIYHGTTDEVLSRGVGHLYGSSLPVGGENTHAVLTSHSGLADATLFTELDQLAMGDVFYITILDKTLAYTVDDIQIVEPHIVDSLVPIAGEDHVTLITCYPVTVNTHRLLVRGSRAPELEEGPDVGTVATTNSDDTTALTAADISYTTTESITTETVFSEYAEMTQHERDRETIKAIMIFGTCAGVFVVIAMILSFATNKKKKE